MIPNPPHVKTKTHKSGGSNFEYRHTCCMDVCVYYKIIPKRMMTNGFIELLASYLLYFIFCSSFSKSINQEES